MTTPEPPVGAAAIPVTFLILAGLMWADVWGHVPEPRPYQPRAPEFASTATVRKPMLETPVLQRGRFTYRCSECHAHFKTEDPLRDRSLGEHNDIKMEHGGNDRCLNCHHPTNRNALVADDGSEIAYKDVEKLCGKCHGPTLRDWRQGVHGRRNGSWDLRNPRMEAQKCTACHAPHSPHFKPIAPAPAPRGPDPGTGRALVMNKEVPRG